MMMNALFALVVVARCATGQEFNDAVAEGIINELSLELRGPWMLLDYDAALIESGLALTDNYSTIDFDLVRGLLEPVGLRAVEVRDPMPPEAAHAPGGVAGSGFGTALAVWRR